MTLIEKLEKAEREQERRWHSDVFSYDLEALELFLLLREAKRALKEAA